MTTPAKLATQLRFHLSELGSRNAHHEFEHLARHVAKARLYSNIQVATGPVSAGGDGARDFETFRTAILPQAGSKFAERASGLRTVVFACTLDKNTEAKIRDDVAKIVADEDIDEIIYFCEPNLPIGRRQKLIDRDDVELRIFDGAALSEWLAEPDLFWIAEEYLHVPAEIAPQPSEVEDSYISLKGSWVGLNVIPVSHAHFVSIKSGLRQATRTSDLRPDLGFWLELISQFLGPNTPRPLVRSAQYEIIVAHLRARGDMTGQKGLVEGFFADVDAHLLQGELADATVLLLYVLGAQRAGAFRVDNAFVVALREQLEGILHQQLEQSWGPGRSAGLLYLLGLLEQFPRQPAGGPNLAGAIGYWNRMLAKAQLAPLYPIESFADHLTDMVSFVGDDAGLLELAARVDDLVGTRLGAVRAGEKAVSRAFSLMDQDQPVAAIRELQSAKAKWMSGERMSGSLAVLLVLSEQYKLLGLAYAAKYHAMLAAYIARYETSDEVRAMQSAALQKVVDLEDVAGNSLGFMQTLVAFLDAHIQLDDKPLDQQAHPEVHVNFGQMAALLGILQRSDPELRRIVDGIAPHWPAILADPIWNGASEPNAFWADGTFEDVWSNLQDAMLDRPFGDLGSQREVRWEALGIDWHVRFANDYRSTPHCEQVLSELQLIAASMAGRDLGVIRSEVLIHIVVDETASEFEIDGESEDADLKVKLPLRDRGQEDIVQTLALFAAALDLCSVLQGQTLMTAFDKASFEVMFVGRPYAELYCDLMPEAGFREDIRMSAGPFEPGRDFISRAGNRLPWFDGPGPGFDDTRARLDAEHRYVKMLPPVRRTIASMIGDDAARRQLTQLGEAGMKDWEIISIIGNIALNERHPMKDGVDVAETMQLWQSLMGQEEAAEDILLPSTFSAKAFSAARLIYLGAFMDAWRLEIPKKAEWPAIEEFLVQRMHLRSVDVPHENVFGWPDDGSEAS